MIRLPAVHRYLTAERCTTCDPDRFISSLLVTYEIQIQYTNVFARAFPLQINEMHKAKLYIQNRTVILLKCSISVFIYMKIFIVL